MSGRHEFGSITQQTVIADFRGRWTAVRWISSLECENTLRRAIRSLEVCPMGRKSRGITEEAIRREWLRKIKELWEKRRQCKRDRA